MTTTKLLLFLIFSKTIISVNNIILICQRKQKECIANELFAYHMDILQQLQEKY